jgi:hypothetical protein
MNAEQIGTMSAGDLLRSFALIVEELRRRKLVRSSNNPVADVTELLVAKALDLTLVANSSAGHDAVDSSGARYQVKGRRLTAHNTSRQLSFIRNLDGKPFDYLVGVLYDADFSIKRACVVPFDIVCQRCAFVKSVNGHKFMLRDDVWNEPTVRDLTQEIAHVFCAIELGH